MKRRHFLASIAPAAGAVLAGCSNAGQDDEAGDSGLVQILASTNVYGDIAKAVGGEAVAVTSIITSAAQDPHEYEASTQERLALDEAGVVVMNGGGYDAFMDTLLEAAPVDIPILNAVEISYGSEQPEGFNEHVWYDLEAVDAVAKELSSTLAELDPANAEAFTQNYEAYAEELSALRQTATDLSATASGRSVALTEPVPVYLLEAVGLENVTPEEFSEAVEEGADVPPRALQETLDLFGDADIALLAYNAQTEDGTTERVREAADEAGVPVVDFTETLPEGQSYVQWQQSNLDNLAAALG